MTVTAVIAWTAGGIALWLAVAIPTAIVLGRAVAEADHRTPTAPVAEVRDYRPWDMSA